MKGRQDTTLMQGRNFTEIGESRWYIIYITEEYIYMMYIVVKENMFTIPRYFEN